MIMSEYLSDIFSWSIGGICFLHKKESCNCLEVTSEIGRRATVQFNVQCVRDGSYFIFTDQKSNNCFPVRKKRVNNSHNNEMLFRRDHFGGLVQFGACDGQTKSGIQVFLPGLSDAFHNYFNGNEDYEWRFNFIRIGMTHTLNLVTVGNLKRLFQRSQVAQATALTNASRAKVLVHCNYGAKITSCWRREISIRIRYFFDEILFHI